MQNKTCQSCKKDFTIEAEDFDFYEKIQVPPPTLCADCRQQRRYAWRNERTLYRRNCDLCGKSTVTIYSANKPFKVYCVPCWWGDGWDQSSYGRDFDFSRPFFEQFSELQHEVPRMALLTKNSINSEYTNHSGDNKNAYLSFSVFTGENIFYSTWIMENSRDCMDCGFIANKGERLYNILDSRASYLCQFGMFLKDCTSCYYTYDCHGCNDCFMSSNLRNQSYMFRNEKCTREEYQEKMKAINFGSNEEREKLYEEFLTLMKESSIHRYVISERNQNTVASLAYDCRNVHESYEVNKCEDSKYIYGGIENRMCMDIYHAGYNMELCYEVQGCTRVSNCQFCHLCYDNMNVSYGDSCQNSQNLFGCVSIKKGEYMIFNKKYSKEEYLELRSKIIAHMKETGEYGEFFPPSIAPVYYNEAQSNLYVPLTKEEVLARGWNWEDNIPGTFGKGTIGIEEIPDNIADVSDEMLKKIYTCAECTKNYNIIPDELTFYRREVIPLPRRCPECRYKKRFALRPARRLWERQCMCREVGHDHPPKDGQANGGSLSASGGEGCGNEFKTPYSPERSERVYCESCYQKEVI